MDELNYIGELFRNKLKNHKIEPSDKVWANIQKNIGSAPVASPKPSLTKYIIGGAAIVSIITASVFLFSYLETGTHNTNQNSTVQNTNTNSDITTTEPSNTNTSNPNISSINSVETSSKDDNSTVQKTNSNSSTTKMDDSKPSSIISYLKTITNTSEKTTPILSNNTNKKETSEPKFVNSEVNEVPKTNIPLDITKDTTVCIGESFKLKAKGGLSIIWSNGDTSDEIEISELKEEQTYVYRAFVHTLAGDTSIMIRVKAMDCHPYEQPNAFTPNGDGTNDEFIPNVPSDCSDYSLMIYNRAGLKVFESRVKDFGWDGKYNNEKQKEGAYFYILQYKNKSNNIKTYRGTIILLPN